MKRIKEFIFAHNSDREKTIFLAFIVFISASLFRLTFLDLIEFKTDEALSMLLASRPLFGYAFPPGATVSSVGIMNPPLVNYLLFPLVVISLDPQIVSMLIGLINVFAITSIFLVIKKYYGIKTAVFTSLLLSFSTWSILLSRKIWNPDLIFPVFVLLFLSIHKLIIEKKQKYWILYAFSCLLFFQIHLDTIFFVIPLTLFLFTKTKINIKYIFIGTLLSLIPLIPYFLYQLNNNCPDCLALINSRNKLATSHQLANFIRPLQIVGVGGFRYVIGNDTLTFQNLFPIPYLLRKFLYIEYLILPLSVFFFYKNYSKLRIFVFITLVLPFLYFIFKVEPLVHYFDVILPILFLFIAVFFNSLTNSKRKLIKVSSYSIFVLILLTFVIFNFYLFKLLSVKQDMDGDYGPVYSLRKKAAEEQLRKYKNDPIYQEMYLMSFVPQSLFHGNLPMAKIFFNTKETKKNISRLEKRLEAVPVDPIAQYELIAYYTEKTPSLEEIKTLRKKSIKKPIYNDIYREVYSNLYLPSHYKNEFYSKSFNLSFDYPRHWSVKEGEGKLVVSGDNTALTVSQIETASMIRINDKIYYFRFTPKKTSTIKEIIDSMR